MRRWWILPILAVAIAWIPMTNFVMALRLLSALASLAGSATGENLPVIQAKIQKRDGQRQLEALVYRPAKSGAQRAIVLVPGISELGCYHPRLVALSRFLADEGFLVVTPDIEKFRQFQIAADAMDDIAFWYRQVHTLEGARNLKSVGLAGISFSGTLALITAARPEIRDNIAFVLAIGPYDDPLRCSRKWFAADPAGAATEYYPTRFYAKWIIMLAASDMIPTEADRKFLRSVLVNLLLQKEVPQPPPGFAPEAQRWYRLAVMRADQTDGELAEIIEKHLTPILYQRITPDRAAADVRCPVFIVHGAYDDLIPPDESLNLKTRLVNTGCSLVISPFITHTHPWEKPLSRSQKAKAIWDLTWLFYRFAQATR